jgi:hypothetical protein
MEINTSDAKTREEALHIIINKMNKAFCIPIAYKLDQSGCSCCLSEYFYLICMMKNEYKIFSYNGYIKHKKTCAIIRCSCNEPFVWKNINPIEEKLENFKNLEYFESFISIIKNDTWVYDLKIFIEQQQENKSIYEYNEDKEEDNYENLKNHKFYFN